MVEMSGTAPESALRINFYRSSILYHPLTYIDHYLVLPCVACVVSDNDSLTYIQNRMNSSDSKEFGGMLFPTMYS